jgi:amidase
LKDLLAAYAGVRLTSGTRCCASYVPVHDSEIVRRHKRAGLVVVGKTNTPELGLVPVTEPELHGPTHTPWKIGHTSGGSSGGSGAAVASGIVPIAHGGDGGGSIRIPASCCGVFGFKPTRGRTPCGPDASDHWFGFAIEHGLTRTVRDSAALLDVTTGPEIGQWSAAPPVERPFLDEVSAPPGKLRIAFTTQPFMPSRVRDECARAVHVMAGALEELGHHVEEDRPAIDPAAFANDYMRCVAVATAMEIELHSRTVGKSPRKEEWEQTTWLVAMMGRQIPGSEFALALESLKALSRDIAPFWERYDVLLTPTLGRPPPKIGELEPQGVEALAQRIIVGGRLSPLLRLPGLIDKMAESVFDFIPFTILANVTGQPSMSVPCMLNDEGLPIGVMLTGAFGDDARLFRLAGQIEKARPWAQKRPPVYSSV